MHPPREASAVRVRRRLLTIPPGVSPWQSPTDMESYIRQKDYESAVTKHSQPNDDVIRISLHGPLTKWPPGSRFTIRVNRRHPHAKSRSPGDLPRYSAQRTRHSQNRLPSNCMQLTIIEVRTQPVVHTTRDLRVFTPITSKWTWLVLVHRELITMKTTDTKTMAFGSKSFACRHLTIGRKNEF